MMKRHMILALTLLVALGVSTTQAAVIVDDGDAGYSTVGAWNESSTGAAEFNGDSDFNNTNAPNQTANFTATIPTTGLWSVEYYVPDNGTRDIPYAVTHDGGTTNLEAAQNQTPLKLQFVSLGYYNLTGGNNYSVTIDASNNSGVIRADAIKWAQVGVDPVADFIVDSRSGIDSFYSESNGWISSSTSSGLYGDQGDRLNQNIDESATYAGLPLGLANYELFLTWEEEDNRASNALVRITDALGGITDLRVDQTAAPSGGGFVHDTSWKSLGVYAFDDASSVQLIVTDDQGGTFLVADGLRFRYDSAFDPGTGGGAIPEPMTAGLALLALGALGLRRRRV